MRLFRIVGALLVVESEHVGKMMVLDKTCNQGLHKVIQNAKLAEYAYNDHVQGYQSKTAMKE